MKLTTQRFVGSYVQFAFPLRYWVTLAFFVGVPGFTRFDVSGLTHSNGLFNPQSLASIALTSTVTTILLSIWLLGGAPLLLRPVQFQRPTWLALFFVYLLASFLEPEFRVLPKPGTDIYLSIYRLSEWILAFLAILSLYSREPVENSFNMMVGFIAKLCWIPICIVWCVLPIDPSMAYTGAGESPSETVTARLGGLVINPVGLAVFAAIAFFHAVFFLRGTRRLVAMGMALLTLSLTYARSQEVILLFLLMAYLTVFSRGATRLLGALGVFVIGTLGVLFQTLIMDYLTRGHGSSNITTLSERTYVWLAAWRAIQQRPWIGYGFVAGVKNAIRDNWNFAHWVPPHAHNELIQASISGGFMAAVLSGLVLFVPQYRAILLSRLDKKYGFFGFALALLIGDAFFSPLLSNSFSSLAGMFLCCSVLVSDHTSLLRAERQHHKAVMI